MPNAFKKMSKWLLSYPPGKLSEKEPLVIWKKREEQCFPVTVYVNSNVYLWMAMVFPWPQPYTLYSSVLLPTHTRAQDGGEYC